MKIKYHKCKEKGCKTKMSFGSPIYCPEHNINNKRVPLSERRLHILGAKYLITCGISQTSDPAKRISDFLAYINTHKNDIL